MAKGDMKRAANGVWMQDTGKTGFGKWQFVGKSHPVVKQTNQVLKAAGHSTTIKAAK